MIKSISIKVVLIFLAYPKTFRAAGTTLLR